MQTWQLEEEVWQLPDVAWLVGGLLLLPLVGGRGNARGDGRRFTITELENLNEVISQVLPIGGAEWDEVANLHSQ
jgi:hypothetical protein